MLLSASTVAWVWQGLYYIQLRALILFASALACHNLYKELVCLH